ncbi:MAG TPA: hypothetical protein VFB50_12415 [Chloroflexota bacterium]|nr:hypothetical protein [Chloroflexota bacterium]
MLTTDQARAIANQWRPKFSDEDAFTTSWQRFMDTVKDRTPEGLERWLETDQERDEVKAVGIPREPLLPRLQALDLQLGECPRCGGDEAVCPTCHGLGFVRLDVPVRHADFGRLLACPSCRP